MPPKPATPVHPGQYVKDEVLPAGLSVTDAAKTLGVGRPALSNFLNGKASLSPDMAMRLEKSFGAPRQKLMALQAEFDQEVAKSQSPSLIVKTYVPALRSITAAQIEDWADGKIEPRSQLAALLRKLVVSTTQELRHSDFPAYDNAERKGWDGQVDAGTATPWVPEGHSGWEFGCNKNILAKANKDFEARVAAIPRLERAAMTFVFVTPRNWKDKDKWAKEKAQSGEWNAVRAYDASDIEQWLEQSLAGQIWFAEKLGLPVSGYRTLDECWRTWAEVTTPELTPPLFQSAVPRIAVDLGKWLQSPPTHPFVIAADSSGEALAFLSCVFAGQVDDAVTNERDLPLVFDTAEALRALAASSAPFIPVVYTSAAEHELAQHFRRLHCIVIRPRNAITSDPNFTLDPPRHDEFVGALEAMKFGYTEANALARRSARSPTVLRRLLAPKNSIIRTPRWADDHDLARNLIPIALVGAWHTASKADTEVVSLIASRPHDEIEKSIARMIAFDDSPVWSVGNYRGVASKIDALFAIRGAVIEDDLKTFFIAAEYVLSERDPKLDLDEDKQWAASLYGKLREHSAALRAGICETLVVLAVHGSELFGGRFGFKPEVEVTRLVHKLLDPFDLDKLLSQNSDLPNYAEAAPEEFLRLVKADLEKPEPASFALMRPVKSELFGGGCPRTGLLWALEGLAWNPLHLTQVVLILAKLATQKIDDNWVNKPEHSLQSIFRSWMPQTAAPLEQRMKTLEALVKKFPKIGWAICIAQFDTHSRIGDYSHRPQWRGDATGVRPVTRRDDYDFVMKSIDLALGWTAHDDETLGDLIKRLQVMPEDRQLKVWSLIDQWAQTAGEPEKARLRERIRRFAFTRFRRNDGLPDSTRKAAQSAYDTLKPSDLVIRHGWLFADTWVEESREEIEEDLDYQAREDRIKSQRLEALREIWDAAGLPGISGLVASSGAPHVIGHLTAQIIRGDDAGRFVGLCLERATGDLKRRFELCLSGFLLQRSADELRAIAKKIEMTRVPEHLEATYLCMPFGPQTWKLLDERGDNFREKYWKAVEVQYFRDGAEPLNEAIERLLEAGRPVSAFHVAHWQWKDVETSRLQRLLNAVATTPHESPSPAKISQHDISEALSSLDGRAGITLDDMALLEFRFMRVLDFGKHGLRNLEKQIANTPDLYVQAIVMCFKRSDQEDDPPEFKIDGEERRSEAAGTAYHLLTHLTRIPATDDGGKIDQDKLIGWIKDVRAACARLARKDIGDQMIGQLLAHAPAGEDGVWPCRPVCEAMEAIASEHLARGFDVGKRNMRGAQFRGEGGNQERELAAEYRGWARQLEYEYPFVAAAIEGIASGYDHEAKWHDGDAKVRSRLPY